MGEVYEGFDRTLERRVAMKCPPKEALIDVRFRKRFLNEARTMAKLRHPHIVQVYDVVEEEDTPALWIVMDFIEGWTEAQWLEEHERFEIDKAVAIAVQVCEGLAHAHAAGVIHRDIKPSNIMFDRAGWAWVMDFGIARQIKNTMHTLTGQQTSGTLAYMAPEQHLGQDRDPRVDIYALGATLYEMVTGHMPFEGIPDLRAAKIEGVFIPPARVSEDVPAALDSTIVKCLAPRAEERHASAEVLAHALRQCGVGIAVPRGPAEVLVPSAPQVGVLASQLSRRSERERIEHRGGEGAAAPSGDGAARSSELPELGQICESKTAQQERARMQGQADDEGWGLFGMGVAIVVTCLVLGGCLLWLFWSTLWSGCFAWLDSVEARGLSRGAVLITFFVVMGIIMTALRGRKLSSGEARFWAIITLVAMPLPTYCLFYTLGTWSDGLSMNQVFNMSAIGGLLLAVLVLILVLRHSRRDRTR